MSESPNEDTLPQFDHAGRHLTIGKPKKSGEQPPEEAAEDEAPTRNALLRAELEKDAFSRLQKRVKGDQPEE